MATLPVMPVVRAAFNRVFNNPNQAFTVGLPYFVLLFAVGVIAVLTQPDDPMAAGGGAVALQFVLTIVQLLIYVAMAVAWHRVTLLGFSVDKGLFRAGFGSRELRFLGYTILIYLPIIAAAVIGGILSAAAGAAIGVIVGLAIFCVGVFVLLRWSMVLPATAADHPTSLKTSWQQTEGNFGPMLGISVIIAVAIFVAVFIVSFVIGLIFGVATGGLGTVGAIVLQLLLIPLQLLGTFVAISGLSYIYRYLSNHPDPLAVTD
ncbi:MAG: hypothetical protein AB7F36_07525 [Reyranellaceae bacterium]